MAPVKLSLFLALSACTFYASDEPRLTTANDQPRVGDKKHKVTARPSVPKAWEGFLLKEPLHAKVIRVLADGRAQIDCGSDRGVRKGMQLYAGTSSLVEVIDVEPKTSVVKVTIPRQGSIEHGQRVHSKDDLDE